MSPGEQHGERCALCAQPIYSDEIATLCGPFVEHLECCNESYEQQLHPVDDDVPLVPDQRGPGA